MKKYRYETHGTCSKYIYIEMDGTTIKNVEFVGGCHGNLQGIAKLVQNQDALAIANKIEGIRCGAKDTSCPDQLATALKKIVKQQQEQNG